MQLSLSSVDAPITVVVDVVADLFVAVGAWRLAAWPTFGCADPHWLGAARRGGVADVTLGDVAWHLADTVTCFESWAAVAFGLTRAVASVADAAKACRADAAITLAVACLAVFVTAHVVGRVGGVRAEICEAVVHERAFGIIIAACEGPVRDPRLAARLQGVSIDPALRIVLIAQHKKFGRDLRRKLGPQNPR
jgi:hypothetical protein